MAMDSPLDKKQLREAVFQALYADYPFHVAKQIPRTERLENDYHCLTLAYGEVTFTGFRDAIELVKARHRLLQRPGGTFLDIGSGTGKAVFSAALAHDFDVCHGIELLAGLVDVSQLILQQWEKHTKKHFPLSIQKKRTRITFIHGDALELEWPTGVVDLVFLNATCFRSELLRELTLTRKLLQHCKPGCIVISTTHPLSPVAAHHAFDLITTMYVPHEASGEATWYIQRRKSTTG